MRNIMSFLPSKAKEAFGEKFKQIQQQPDYRSAKAYAAIALETGLEDSLQYYNFPQLDPRKISSTNKHIKTVKPRNTEAHLGSRECPWYRVIYTLSYDVYD